MNAINFLRILKCGVPNSNSFFYMVIFYPHVAYLYKDQFLQTRKDATQVVANLQRQQVHSRLIASDYLEANIDLMDVLISG